MATAANVEHRQGPYRNANAFPLFLDRRRFLTRERLVTHIAKQLLSDKMLPLAYVKYRAQELYQYYNEVERIPFPADSLFLHAIEQKFNFGRTNISEEVAAILDRFYAICPNKMERPHFHPNFLYKLQRIAYTIFHKEVNELAFCISLSAKIDIIFQKCIIRGHIDNRWNAIPLTYVSKMKTIGHIMKDTIAVNGLYTKCAPYFGAVDSSSKTANEKIIEIGRALYGLGFDFGGEKSHIQNINILFKNAIYVHRLPNQRQYLKNSPFSFRVNLILFTLLSKTYRYLQPLNFF